MLQPSPRLVFAALLPLCALGIVAVLPVWWQLAAYPLAAVVAMALLVLAVWAVAGGRWAAVALVVCAVVGVFIARLQAQQAHWEDVVAVAHREGAREWQGTVIGQPEYRTSSMAVPVRLQGEPLEGEHVVLQLQQAPDELPRLGDTVSFRSRLEQPISFAGGSAVFVGARSGVFLSARIAADALDVLPDAPAVDGFTRASTAMDALRQSITDRLLTVLPGAPGGLVAGIYTGDTSGLAPGVYEAMLQVNLAHIVAVSGYNITVLAAFCLGLLAWTPRRVAIIITAVVIIAYLLLVGLQAPTLRAGIMGLLGLAGLFFGRRSAALQGLALAVVALCIWHPFLALYDIGLWLSVAATAGIIFHSSGWQEALAPRLGLLAPGVAVALAAELYTLPLVVASFGFFSVFGILANVLADPLMPLIMLSAGVAAVGGGLFAPLAWPALALLQVLLQGALWLASPAWQYVPVPWWLAQLALLAYVPLLLWGVPRLVGSPSVDQGPADK